MRYGKLVVAIHDFEAKFSTRLDNTLNPLSRKDAKTQRTAVSGSALRLSDFARAHLLILQPVYDSLHPIFDQLLATDDL